MSLFTLFLITSLANILSPGMGVIFAISLSLQQGWHRTIFFGLGQAIGISLLFTLALSGMGLILASSPALFAAIKVCGAFVVIYLGLKSWRKPPIHFAQQAGAGDEAHPGSMDIVSNLTKGIVISLCNPQPIIFGISVLPQFIDPAKPYVAQSVVMIVVYAVLVFINLGMYSILAENARRFFTGPSGSLMINKATAVVFFLIGLIVLVSALWDIVSR